MAKKTKQIPEPESDSELNIDQADVNKDSDVEAEKEMKVSKVKKEKALKEPKKAPKSKKEKVVDDLENEVEIPSKKGKKEDKKASKSATKKAVSDSGKKPNGWISFVKDLKSKKKYQDLSYKELLKVASEQYKKK